MSWWKHATTEQRLTQIDGAIECGMSSVITAKNLGVPSSTLRAFAADHGRRFSGKTPPSILRSNGIRASNDARRAAKRPEFSARDAFDIFGVKRHSELLTWGNE